MAMSTPTLSNRARRQPRGTGSGFNPQRSTRQPGSPSFTQGELALGRPRQSPTLTQVNPFAPVGPQPNPENPANIRQSLNDQFPNFQIGNLPLQLFDGASPSFAAATSTGNPYAQFATPAELDMINAIQTNPELDEFQRTTLTNNILSSVTARTEATAGRLRAIDSLEESRDNFTRNVENIFNNPARTQLLDDLNKLSTEDVFSDDLVASLQEEANRQIGRSIGEATGPAGSALAGSRLGRSSIAHQLAGQARRNAAELRVGASNELRTRQFEINDSARRYYNGLRAQVQNQETAQRLAFEEITQGINTNIAALEGVSDFVPTDFTPVAGFIEGLRAVADEQERLDREEERVDREVNPNPLELIFTAIFTAIAGFMPPLVGTALGTQIPDFARAASDFFQPPQQQGAA